MSQYVLSFDQVSSALRMAGLDPVPGAPLEGVGTTLLDSGDMGFRQMAAHDLLLRENGSWRVNRAFALSLAVAAAPEEAVWIEADGGEHRLTLARRESIAAEYTVRTDGLIKMEFPQVWSVLEDILSQAFGGEDEPQKKSNEESEDNTFDFRGQGDEALVLSLISDAAAQNQPCRLENLQDFVNRALAIPARTMPFVNLGCGDALLNLMPESSSAQDCVLSLITSGLINADAGMLRPTTSVQSALKPEGPLADLAIRRRIFTADGHATMGIGAVRSKNRTVICTSVPGRHGDVELHWRTTTREELAGETRKILAL